MNATRYTLTSVLVLCLACSPDEPGYTPSDGFLDGDQPPDTTDGGCTSTAPFCSADRTQVLECNLMTGSAEVVTTCVSPQICIDGACVDAACVPGTSECVDVDTMRRCRSDGSGYEEVDCPEGQECNPESGICEFPCLLRVLILLDQSGSMSEPETNPKWNQARTALSTLMSSETAAEVEFGLASFPSDGNCATDGIVIHPVPDADASIVDSYFTSNSPYGNTPLVESLEFFTSDTTANLNDPDYHNYILVVSDGMDSCYTDLDACVLGCMTSPTPLICIAECEAAAAAVTVPALRMYTSHLREDLEIRTFVVGFGADVSDEELSAIAEEGGTELGTWLAASDVSELVVAFETALEEMWECNDIIH
jgi:hypothetical protein